MHFQIVDYKMLTCVSEQVLLFSSSLILCCFFITSLQFLKMFINSKPPGRKMVRHQGSVWNKFHKIMWATLMIYLFFYLFMIIFWCFYSYSKVILESVQTYVLLQVTADIHMYHVTSFQMIIFNFFFANLIKSIMISCGYWLTFIFIEMIKFSLLLFISFANVSSVLQVAVSFDFRYLI